MAPPLWWILSEIRLKTPRPIAHLVVPMAYLGLGCLFYTQAETLPCEGVNQSVPEGSNQNVPEWSNQSVAGELSECSWSFVDALYFSMVTISTVGYGDLTPTTRFSKLFTVCYILLGCTTVFYHLAQLTTMVMHGFRQSWLLIIDRFDSSEHVAGRSLGLSGEGVDLTGDGNVDFIHPPPAYLFWAQEMMPISVLAAAIQCISAAIFCWTEPGLDFGDAMYHCIVTATTVGYGDVALTTNGSKLFATLHVALSVSWLGALVGEVSVLQARRKAQIDRADVLLRQMDVDEIVELDKDGKGVDKLEFAIGMMIVLGVELCGEKLTWEAMQPFLKKFDKIDHSNTGRIDREDLERLARQGRDEVIAKSKAGKGPDLKESDLDGLVGAMRARTDSIFAISRVKNLSHRLREQVGDTKVALPPRASVPSKQRQDAGPTTSAGLASTCSPALQGTQSFQSV